MLKPRHNTPSLIYDHVPRPGLVALHYSFTPHPSSTCQCFSSANTLIFSTLSVRQPPMPLPDHPGGPGGGGGPGGHHQGAPAPHVPPKPQPLQSPAGVGPAATEDHNQNNVLKPAAAAAAAAASRDNKPHEPQRLSHEQVRGRSGGSQRGEGSVQRNQRDPVSWTDDQGTGLW